MNTMIIQPFSVFQDLAYCRAFGENVRLQPAEGNGRKGGLDMKFDEAQYGNAIVLLPEGRLDQDTAAAFQERLLEAVGGGNEAVIVDFSKIPYISSVGLRAIMIAAKQSKSDGVSLSVADLTDTVREIFEISRFNFVVTVHESLRDAVAAVSPEALSAFEGS